MLRNSLIDELVVDEEYSTPAFLTTSPYVLVVDDDRDILSVIMLLLETEGYAGLGFSNSRKVLPFLERVQAAAKDRGPGLPSVILLDLMMPGISGYEIAAWLAGHTWCAHIPVIVMTADPRIHGVSNIPGATDWLSKPFQLDALLTRLERYLAPTFAV